jgi:hypothetical protein
MFTEHNTTVYLKRRISIFLPLVLIALGVILLLSNLSAVRWDVWDVLFIFWPLLFVAGGLDGLVQGENPVWQVFWVGVGVMLIAGNLGLLAWSNWEIALKLWPLILVAAGLSIFARHSLTGSLIGVAVVIVLFAGAVWLMIGSAPSAAGEAATGSQRIVQPVADAREANVNMDLPAGALSVAALSEPVGQLEVTYAQPDTLALEQNTRVDNGVAYYTLRAQGTAAWMPFSGRGQIKWAVRLNPDTPVTLKAKLAAGDLVADLTGLRLVDYRSETVVGATRLTLPAEGRFEARVENVIGDVTIVVPKGMAVRLRADTVLVAVQTPEDFTREDERYLSPNLEGADSIVDLRVGLVIGRVSVEYAD